MIATTTAERLATVLRFGTLLPLISPLVVIPGLIFPFHTGRTVFFQIIIAALFVPWVWLVFASPAHRPRPSLPLLVLLGFLSVHFITGLFGIYFAQSFWGRDERMMGSFTLIHVGLWAVFTASVFRDARAWRLPVGVSIAAATAVALLAIHERFFPGVWRVLAGGGSRAISTLGNPIFLANYLMPHLFLAAWLAVRGSRTMRVLLGAGAAVILLALIYAGTRGAYLGNTA